MIGLLGIPGALPVFSVCQTLPVVGYAGTPCHAFQTLRGAGSRAAAFKAHMASKKHLRAAKKAGLADDQEEQLGRIVWAEAVQQRNEAAETHGERLVRMQEVRLLCFVVGMFEQGGRGARRAPRAHAGGAPLALVLLACFCFVGMFREEEAHGERLVRMQQVRLSHALFVWHCRDVHMGRVTRVASTGSVDSVRMQANCVFLFLCLA